MADQKNTQQLFESMKKKWPTASGAPPGDQVASAPGPNGSSASPASSTDGAQQANSKPEMSSGERLLTQLSDRERKIVKDVIGKVDLGKFLTDNSVSVELAIRGDLKVTLCSPFASNALDYQIYLANLKSKREISDVEESQHRIVWQLATDLRALNGIPWMVGADPITGRDSRIQRVREMSKHVLEQLAWAHNLFNIGLTIACDAESSEFQEKLKNS